MKDPPLVEQEGHLFASFVELALRPALHLPRARHWVRTWLDAQFERRAVVGRKARRRAGKDLTLLGGQRSEVRRVACVGW